MRFFNEKRYVLITAGAGGIGRQLVEQYIDQDCQVYTCDIDQAAIKKLVRDCPKVFARQCDVSKWEDVQSFLRMVGEKTDHLDVLINCAGIAGPTALLEQVDPADWQQTINVNINGMFYVTKAAVPLIRRSTHGASVINIASSASFFGFPLRSPYTAAKWATIGMTKTLAMELGPDGIRVNAICPGSVSGERIDRVIKADADAQDKTIEEIRKSYVRQVSMRTFVGPDDVAHMALFLSSDFGRFISGQAIGLDGHTEGLSTEI